MMGWFNEGNIKKLLNVPKSERIALIIAVGYPSNPMPREKVRKKLNDIYSYNKK